MTKKSPTKRKMCREFRTEALPPLYKLSSLSWAFSRSIHQRCLLGGRKRLWWKPSFNLEFNKNWLSITEHKQSCSINLSALFVQEWKKTLSAEADDRCWLKDKYYLYFCSRFLLMHILSCMGIQSTKQFFYISQRPYNIQLLHGNLFYIVHANSPKMEKIEKFQENAYNYCFKCFLCCCTEINNYKLDKLSFTNMSLCI